MSIVAPLVRIPVGIVVERRKATSLWADLVWQPVAVLPGLPDAVPWTPLAQDGDSVTYYAGPGEIALFRTEADNYRRNLESGAPSVWVALEATGGDPPFEIAAVTADPAEGEALTEPGQAIVEALAMPEAVFDAVARFVAQYPAAPPFTKRNRDRADPEILARRDPGLGKDHGGKTMSEDDGFLARWSRRKRSSAARQRDTVTPKTPADAADTIAPNLAAASAGREADEALSEPPSLPPIDSLDAASDITPFLAPGVPAELTRQALRKAWESDPAIRDFVGLSENSWDFNAPDGVPGFGSLTPEEITRLLDAVAGEPDSAGPPPDAPGPSTAEPPALPAATDATSAGKIAPETALAAAQPEAERQKPRDPAPGRRHGSALPQ